MDKPLDQKRVDTSSIVLSKEKFFFCLLHHPKRFHRAMSNITRTDVETMENALQIMVITSITGQSIRSFTLSQLSVEMDVFKVDFRKNNVVLRGCIERMKESFFYK